MVALLFPKEFVVYSDYEAFKHLRSQNKLRKANIVVDALYRRHSLLSMLETKLLELYLKDEFFLKKSIIYVLMVQVEVSTYMMGFSLKIKNYFVKRLLVKMAHEDGLMGHFGKYKTCKTLLEHFFGLI
ncbi:hypothetical protein CR513_21520, partial [Mucuna pruriens]